MLPRGLLSLHVSFVGSSTGDAYHGEARVGHGLCALPFFSCENQHQYKNRCTWVASRSSSF